MFYDMWHRATGSSLPDDIDVPVGERDPAQTRWMSKFRFWRMEEPGAPSWAGEGPAHPSCPARIEAAPRLAAEGGGPATGPQLPPAARAASAAFVLFTRSS